MTIAITMQALHRFRTTARTPRGARPRAARAHFALCSILVVDDGSPPHGARPCSKSLEIASHFAQTPGAKATNHDSMNTSSQLSARVTWYISGTRAQTLRARASSSRAPRSQTSGDCRRSCRRATSSGRARRADAPRPRACGRTRRPSIEPLASALQRPVVACLRVRVEGWLRSPPARSARLGARHTSQRRERSARTKGRVPRPRGGSRASAALGRPEACPPPSLALCIPITQVLRTGLPFSTQALDVGLRAALGTGAPFAPASGSGSTSDGRRRRGLRTANLPRAHATYADTSRRLNDEPRPWDHLAAVRHHR